MSITEHLGNPHPKTWKAGATCDTCQASVQQRKAEVWQGSPLVGSLGASRDGDPQYQFERDWEPGLDAYRTAKADGIQPDQSNLMAVDRAHKVIASQEAALKKIKNFSDIDGVKTAAGVDRDV